jgi:biopolymer transport protein ExbD
MGKGSMIIRLIDIALTVLFGFIAVSDVEQKSQVKLPRDVTGVSTPTQINTLSILIFEGPQYTLMDGTREIYRDQDLERVEQQLIRIREIYREQNQDVVFLIQPDPNSPIQLMVNVLDVCERNQLKKSINYVEPGV